ncbi:hypothetical protein GCM10010103_48600 [Streptomyces paradoxus]|uniref:Uncharacterized protein n=1 Tax=Streptomyces paradoxus TaxID=66375 RepID=A0A7W9WJE0_9ACTN|nr:hypothetical protein [Streptomyces paradoxus]MBB6078455.1 hypothetical protein [Streptomyces paradoxus]
MSTEAPRASFPPRPTTPPRPSHPPSAPATDERDTPGGASGPATGPAAAPNSSDRPDGRPRFPVLGAGNAGSAGRTEPTAPPPPRASTRFPDTPPSVGREPRAGSDRLSGIGGETSPGSNGPSGAGRETGPGSDTSTGVGRETRLSSKRLPGVGPETRPGSNMPPRASTRFPDAPPSVGRETRAASDRLSGIGRETSPGSNGPSGAGPETRPGPDTPPGVGRDTRVGSNGPSRAGREVRPGSDTPPGLGRDTRPGPDKPATSPGPDAPPRPRHLPTPGSSGRTGRPDTTAGAPQETPARPFRLSAPGGSGAQAGAPSETAGRPFRLPTPRRTGAPGENTSETTARLRPVPADPAKDEAASPFARPATPPRPAHEPQAPSAPVAPDPALSWSATRPLVSFGEPEGYDGDARPRPLGRRGAPQAAAAAVCLVLGLGLISGAVTGSWLVGGSGEDGAPSTFAAAGSLWHSVPVDQLFPPTVQGRGAGPGGADRTWTRIAVAPDSGCKNAFDPLLRKALAPVGCDRLLRATYTDATESYVTTVGLLFTTADAPGMTALANRFRKERLDRRSDLMPLPYAAKGTLAAGFGARQRASWTVSVLTEAPVVVYAVSGWADGRTVDDPQPARDAVEADATTAAAQAGLGNEAKGLADRVERDFRRNVRSASEQPS